MEKKSSQRLEKVSINNCFYKHLITQKVATLVKITKHKNTEVKNKMSWLFSRVDINDDGEIEELERHEIDRNGNHHSYATNDGWLTHAHHVVDSNGNEVYSRSNIKNSEAHPWTSRYNK